MVTFPGIDRFVALGVLVALLASLSVAVGAMALDRVDGAGADVEVVAVPIEPSGKTPPSSPIDEATSAWVGEEDLSDAGPRAPRIEPVGSVVGAGGLACTVDEVAGTLSWALGPAGIAHVGLIQNDTTRYLGAFDTGATGAGSLGITEVAGTYSVHYFTPSRVWATCDGPGTQVVGFTCEVDAAAGELRWSGGQYGTAHVGLRQDGVPSYLGSVATPREDSGSMPIDSLYGAFEVWYHDVGTVSTTCDGPATDATRFRCSVDEGAMTLTWQHGPDGTAYAGQVIDAERRYLGATESGSIDIEDTDGFFEVHYYEGRHLQTTCAVTPAAGGG